MPLARQRLKTMSSMIAASSRGVSPHDGLIRPALAAQMCGI
jgi:hypothetical protein